MNTLAMWNNPTGLIILAVVALVLFGGQKIPEMMRGLGQGMREFKKGMHTEDDDELRRDKEHREGVASASTAQTDAEREQEIRRRVEAEMRKERGEKQL